MARISHKKTEHADWAHTTAHLLLAVLVDGEDYYDCA